MHKSSGLAQTVLALKGGATEMDGYEYNMHAGPPFQTLACMQWLATSETCGKENRQLPATSVHHLFQIRSAVIRDFNRE